MLVRIDTAVERLIRLHARDNVGVARVALGLVPAGHKVALREIAAGETVYRYGEPIGVASEHIAAGAHVHTHNLQFVPVTGAVVRELPAARVAAEPRTFLGYRRADGRVGTRNYIAVVAASNCAAYTAGLVERQFAQAETPAGVDGVVSFPHGDGCGQALGPDTDQLRRTLQGVLAHPNVAGAVLLGLGCEVNQVDHYTGKGLVRMTLQESGGTRNTVAAAAETIGRMMGAAAACERVPVSAAELVLGLNCGGSDSFSGITANPALGVCCDLIVAQGGTVVLAETTEIFGAEHLLLRRARSEAVARKLTACVDGYRAYLNRFAGSFDDNPSPGNKKGGLTNIVEKSLGAVAKAGSTVLEDVVEYAERVRSRGFVFMNTPGYDPASLAGLAAGGVNLIAFTTGRGSAIGFPTVPVFKISSNSGTFARMADNMDLDAGVIATGEQTVEQVGAAMFERLLRVASGEKTKAEVLGHHEFVPWRIGPVL